MQIITWPQTVFIIGSILFSFMVANADNLSDGQKAEAEHNDIEARRLYYESCYHGGAEGCWYAGKLELQLENTSEALRLFQNACDGAFVDGCRDYKVLNQKLLKKQTQVIVQTDPRRRAIEHWIDTSPPEPMPSKNSLGPQGAVYRSYVDGSEYPLH